MNLKLNIFFWQIEVKLLCEWWNKSCVNQNWVSDDSLISDYKALAMVKIHMPGVGCTMWNGG